MPIFSKNMIDAQGPSYLWVGDSQYKPQQYVTLPVDHPFRKHDFTIEMTFCLLDSTKYNNENWHWLLKTGNDAGHYTATMYITLVNGYFRISVGGWFNDVITNQPISNSVGNPRLDDGTWHHFALTRINGTYQAYVDGALYGTGYTPTVTDFTNNNWRVGQAPGHYDSSMGEIGKVRFFNVGLTHNEIVDLAGGAAVPFKYTYARQFDLFQPSTSWSRNSGAGNWYAAHQTNGTHTYVGDTANYVSSPTSMRLRMDGSSGGIMDSWTSWFYRVSTWNNSDVYKRFRYNFDVAHSSGDSTKLQFGVGYYSRKQLTSALAVETVDAHSTADNFIADDHTHRIISQTAGAGSLTWKNLTYEFTLMDVTDAMNRNQPTFAIWKESGSTQATWYLDNIKIDRIGCVAEYLPTGITPTKWYDSSGNDRHSTVVTGVQAHNYKRGVIKVSNLKTSSMSFSGTVTSQDLDAYEEGTWTPVPVASGVTFTTTSAHTVGRYTKIGQLVTFAGKIRVSNVNSSTSTSSLSISGLPFAAEHAWPQNAVNIVTIQIQRGTNSQGSIGNAAYINDHSFFPHSFVDHTDDTGGWKTWKARELYKSGGYTELHFRGEYTAKR